MRNGMKCSFVQRFVNHVPRGRVRYTISKLSRHSVAKQGREFAKLALSFIQRSCSTS